MVHTQPSSFATTSPASSSRSTSEVMAAPSTSRTRTIARTLPSGNGLNCFQVARREGSDGAPVLELHKDIPIKLPARPFLVDVSKFEIANITHYDLVPKGVKPTPDYDNRHLPRFLFLGAALLTFGMLCFILRLLLRVRRAQTELPHTIPPAVVSPTAPASPG